MSTVEQIHHLESRVDRLLVTLRELRTAHDALRGELAACEQRAAELESRLAVSENARQEADRRGDGLEQRLSHLQAEHEEIEATIARTLDQLGRLDIGAAGEPAGETPGVDDGGPAARPAVAPSRRRGRDPINRPAMTAPTHLWPARRRLRLPTKRRPAARRRPKRLSTMATNNTRPMNRRQTPTTERATNSIYSEYRRGRRWWSI